MRQSDGGHRTGPGTCVVWWASLDDAVPALAALLDVAELRQVEAHRNDDDRRRALLARALLRLGAAHHAGAELRDVAVVTICDRCGGPHGRPRVRVGGESVEASVTHGGDVVGVAVAAGFRVGLDVEPLEQQLPADLEEWVLAPSERPATHRESDRTRSLLRLWTRKEALLKASGVGLGVPMTDVVLSRADEPPALLAATEACGIGPEVVLVDLHARRGHLASLALLGPEATVRERDASLLLRTA
jgi:4'-phosphopantetheinyl transferase